MRASPARRTSVTRPPQWRTPSQELGAPARRRRSSPRPRERIGLERTARPGCGWSPPPKPTGSRAAAGRRLRSPSGADRRCRARTCSKKLLVSGAPNGEVSRYDKTVNSRAFRASSALRADACSGERSTSRGAACTISTISWLCRSPMRWCARRGRPLPPSCEVGASITFQCFELGKASDVVASLIAAV